MFPPGIEWYDRVVVGGQDVLQQPQRLVEGRCRSKVRWRKLNLVGKSSESYIHHRCIIIIIIITSLHPPIGQQSKGSVISIRICGATWGMCDHLICPKKTLINSHLHGFNKIKKIHLEWHPMTVHTVGTTHVNNSNSLYN